MKSDTRMLKYFTVGSALYFVLSVNGLQLNVTPANIEPGTTKTLIVNCSLNIESTPPFVILNSLILLRSNDVNTSVHDVLASINSINGRVVVYDGDGVGSGFVNNYVGSYLCIQWSFPMTDKASRYICEVNGMSLSGVPKTYSTSAQVSSSTVTLKSILQQLRIGKLENSKRLEENKQLNDIVKVLQDNVTKSTEFINKMDQKNSASLKSLFIESPPYNGRRYYLSRQLILVQSIMAQVTCDKYGGYLAEIDDESEFQFVRTFLNNYKSTLGVMIAGTDEGHENYWVNPRNNTALTYTKWGNTEPNGGIKENCVYLSSDYDWNMIDVSCVYFNTDKKCEYLCEIEQK